MTNRFLAMVEDFYDLTDTHDSVTHHNDITDDQEFGMELSPAVAAAEAELEIAYNTIHSTIEHESNDHTVINMKSV